LSELTSAGLLVRAGRGEYRLTSSGTLITLLGDELAEHDALADGDTEEPDGEMVIRISDTSGGLSELLPLATELVAEVRRTRMTGEVIESHRLRVSRME
jgi:hypothetical protein